MTKNFHFLAHEFLEEIEALQKKVGIDFFSYQIDHLCYRVENDFDYSYKKEELEKLGTLLVESLVGGRQIASFKLFEPIIYKNQKIEVIELPAPKEGSFYADGFEHAELVIQENFEDFQAKYSNLTFDTSSSTKSHNPEIRLKLSKKVSLKFHHKSLEETIYQELTMK